MIYNVAQLMKSQIGASLEFDIDEEDVQLDNDLRVIGPLTGRVRMRRINQGLLVDGWFELLLGLTCTRCLNDFEQTKHIVFTERFNPTVDVLTGVVLPPIEEDDIFSIDDHHQVDLAEAIRQRILLDVPMVTLCREECAGLCSQCGKDLNLGPCNCQPEVDARLSILNVLLQQGSES